MAETKLRYFQITLGDLEWLDWLKQRANEETLSNITYSEILADLFAFARDRGYVHGKRP